MTAGLWPTYINLSYARPCIKNLPLGKNQPKHLMESTSLIQYLQTVQYPWGVIRNKKFLYGSPTTHAATYTMWFITSRQLL